MNIIEDGITFLDFDRDDTGDGGYRDVCSSLIEQIKHVEMKYKDQLAGLNIRRRKLKDDIKSDLIASVMCIVSLFLVLGFRYILGLLSKLSGVFAVFGVFISVLFPAAVVTVLFFILPSYLRRLSLNVRNDHIMNEHFDDEVIIDREVITFPQEERYIRERLYEIELARKMHMKVEAEYSGRIDEDWDECIQEDVDRLRKASIYREYYACGIKKDDALKQAWIATLCFLTVIILIVYWMVLKGL